MTETAELMANIAKMSTAERLEVEAALRSETPVWVPQEGPQSAAYYSLADIVFYGGSAGGGKGLALETQLPTPSGWIPMADVQVGTWLLSDSGEPCQVLAVSLVQNRRCFRLTFDDDSTIVADDVHRWVTFDARELGQLSRLSSEFRARRRQNRGSKATGNKSEAFTAALRIRNSARAHVVQPAPVGTMRDTLEIAQSLRTPAGRTNHAIRLAAALQLPEADLLVPPYTLGAWLGDGISASGGFTGEDPEILQRIADDGFEVTSSKTDRLSHYIRGLKPSLRTLGVLRDKHIPPAYLRASAGQRLALLQGLMDTDGHAALDGGCEFDGMNERLVDGVLELALSLGLKATKLAGRATLHGRDVGAKWRVRFTTDHPVFHLARKVDRLAAPKRRTGNFRYIVRCDEVESVPTRCIAVSSPSRLFLAGRQMVPTHNTDLLLGTSLTTQQHSIIFRREAVQLTGLEERMTKILGTRKGYNSQTGVWRLPGNRIMELGSVQGADDWLKYQGRGHDLKGFDEICHFLESQFRTLIGWMRTDDPSVRQRVICAGNPPTNSEGEWVIRYWAPWLDPMYPKPAKPGELRWFITNADGKDEEVVGPEPVLVDGENVYPKSRTFISSNVDDNLFLQITGYRATLQQLPEPLRSQMLRGDFQAGRTDPVWQLVPTEWVKAAQARWKKREAKGAMTCLGFDPARGGIDKSTVARRHGQWFDELVAAPGIVTKDGPTAAGFIVPLVRNGACICVDSIGIGSSALDFLVGLNLLVLPVVGSAASGLLDKSGQLRFRNKRAEMYWRMREALDPTNPDPIELPPDQELLADLCAVRYKVVTMGKVAAIQVRDKDEIREVLGRSPDKGDAVAMTFVIGIPDAKSQTKYAPPPPPDWRL